MAHGVYCSMSVRDVIVQCLLYTKATRTILDSIRTAVDTVEAVLATQSRYATTNTTATLGLKKTKLFLFFANFAP